MNNISEIISHSSWQINHLLDEFIQLKKTLTISLCVLVVDFVTESKMSGFPFNSSSRASWRCCLLLSLALATISSRVGIFVAVTWLGHSMVWKIIHHLALRNKHKLTCKPFSECKQITQAVSIKAFYEFWNAKNKLYKYLLEVLVSVKNSPSWKNETHVLKSR